MGSEGNPRNDRRRAQGPRRKDHGRVHSGGKALNVLFVCVHNAGRSQMAEAFFNAFAAEQGLAHRAESAGTRGAGSLNLVAVEAMAEVGVPMDMQRPKELTPDMVSRADFIVSMGCGVDAEACPTRFLVAEDWGLDDPAGQTISDVRPIRDQIQVKVKAMLAAMA